jgi:hypothetical protein
MRDCFKRLPGGVSSCSGRAEWVRPPGCTANCPLLYLGARRWHDRGIDIVPFVDCVSRLDQWL